MGNSLLNRRHYQPTSCFIRNIKDNSIVWDVTVHPTYIYSVQKGNNMHVHIAVYVMWGLFKILQYFSSEA